MAQATAAVPAMESVSVSWLQAKAPTFQVTHGTKIRKGVVKAVHQVGMRGKATCFTVYVHPKDRRYATWSYSTKAYSRPSCHMIDGDLQLFRRAHGHLARLEVYRGVETKRACLRSAVNESVPAAVRKSFCGHALPR